MGCSLVLLNVTHCMFPNNKGNVFISNAGRRKVIVLSVCGFLTIDSGIAAKFPNHVVPLQEVAPSSKGLCNHQILLIMVDECFY